MLLYKSDNKYFVVDYDIYAESPREYDNLFAFYGWNNSHASPDNNPYPTFYDFVDEYGEPETWGNDDNLILTVSIYDHTNVAFDISTEFVNCIGDRWDSCIFGVMVANHADILRWLGEDEINDRVLDRAFDFAKGELESYEHWVNGEIFKINEVEIIDGDLDYIDGCGGYESIESALGDYGIGSDDYIGACDTECGIIQLIEENKNEI